MQARKLLKAKECPLSDTLFSKIVADSGTFSKISADVSKGRRCFSFLMLTQLRFPFQHYVGQHNSACAVRYYFSKAQKSAIILEKNP